MSNIGSQDYVSTEIEEAFKAGANGCLKKPFSVLPRKFQSLTPYFTL